MATFRDSDSLPFGLQYNEVEPDTPAWHDPGVGADDGLLFPGQSLGGDDVYPGPIRRELPAFSINPDAATNASGNGVLELH